VGTQTVIDDNPKLDERLDWRQSCPNRFDQKVATKKSHVLDNQIKLLFSQNDN
jgi:riboflavin biosynthesis pyrimidine reductase